MCLLQGCEHQQAQHRTQLESGAVDHLALRRLVCGLVCMRHKPTLMLFSAPPCRTCFLVVINTVGYSQLKTVGSPIALSNVCGFALAAQVSRWHQSCFPLLLLVLQVIQFVANRANSVLFYAQRYVSGTPGFSPSLRGIQSPTIGAMRAFAGQYFDTSGSFTAPYLPPAVPNPLKVQHRQHRFGPHAAWSMPAQKMGRRGKGLREPAGFGLFLHGAQKPGSCTPVVGVASLGAGCSGQRPPPTHPLTAATVQTEYQATLSTTYQLLMTEYDAML
jgi:hypothetical protein